MLRPRYGAVGMLAYPYFFFLEMLGPLIEFAGYGTLLLAVLLGRVSPLYGLTFFLLAFVMGGALSAAAVCLEELTIRRYPTTRNLAHLMILAFAEPFGYRQLNTYWRVRGLISAWRGHQHWGEMSRRGFVAESAA